MVLSLFVAAANSAQLVCEFVFNTIPEPEYQCSATIETTKTDYFVDGISGDHVAGKRNYDISTVVFKNKSIEVLPRNLNIWFRNFNQLSVINDDVIPNFQRADFYDFTRLRSFHAKNLPKVTDIPRDTFWDLTSLVNLFLDEMPNMTNLDSDLLKNAVALRVFSARGPNKIDQINPGFFRNQINSLEAVDFRDSRLLRIGFSVFVNLDTLHIARFENAGCLTKLYNVSQIQNLTGDIRATCQDVTSRRQNNIIKQADSSSSESQ